MEQPEKKLTHLGIRKKANEIFFKLQDLNIEAEKLYAQCDHEFHKKIKFEYLPSKYIWVDACMFCDKIFGEIKEDLNTSENNNK